MTLDDLQGMSVREGFIVIMRSNLLGVVWTYKQLGEWFGVSGGRIGQIEYKALAKACWGRFNRGPVAYQNGRRWSFEQHTKQRVRQLALDAWE